MVRCQVLVDICLQLGVIDLKTLGGNQMPEFMLLMRGSQDGFNNMTEAEQREIVSQHVAWSQQLAEKEILAGGDGCSSQTVMLKPEGGEIRQVPKPFGSTDNEVSGFYIIQANDIQSALEIAKQCPALRHNESVEVIPLGH
jgi:hypothetical protein